MGTGNPNIAEHGKDTQFQSGQSGNPDGKPKGIKNWSTIVQELLADEKFLAKVLESRDEVPAWVDTLPNRNAAYAVVAAMAIRAMNGDHKAATWLRRTGYGDKLDLTSGDKPIQPVQIIDLGKEQPRANQPKAGEAGEAGKVPALPGNTPDRPARDQ